MTRHAISNQHLLSSALRPAILRVTSHCSTIVRPHHPPRLFRTCQTSALRARLFGLPNCCCWPDQPRSQLAHAGLGSLARSYPPSLRQRVDTPVRPAQQPRDDPRCLISVPRSGCQCAIFTARNLYQLLGIGAAPTSLCRTILRRKTLPYTYYPECFSISSNQ
jgi:hypothetical protein